MYEVADRPDIYITVLTGRGRFFSAGADVGFVDGVEGEAGKEVDEREKWLKGFVAGNLHVRFHHSANLNCFLRRWKAYHLVNISISAG